MQFFIGLFFGACCGMILSIFLCSIGYEDHSKDEYHRGYLDGWHDAGGKGKG